MMGKRRTVLLVGGGSGGHIYPNIAVAERLYGLDTDLAVHFVVSDRPLDNTIMSQDSLEHTATLARPFSVRPVCWADFVCGYYRACAQVSALIERTSATAMIATGGFVSAPAVAAAVKKNLPVALVNLDSLPGKANRLVARKVQAVFSVYLTAVLPGAQQIGLPLRLAALATEPASVSRRHFGLEPQAQTLLVFAGSQAARSINQMMMQFCAHASLAGWQVLHIAGEQDRQAVSNAYSQAGVQATVLPYCHQMGLAWSAATVAICRAGAGSVAEAWTNRVPAVFMPYPHHQDHHQAQNVRPLVDRGGAVLLTDLVDPNANAQRLQSVLPPLLGDSQQQQQMRGCLEQNQFVDGADILAKWALSH